MSEKKNIFAIIGSASSNSANEKLINYFAALTKNYFNLTIFNGLKTLPHFDPELSANKPPKEIIDFRKSIETADGIIICTPEYVFSIPSGLKNAIEWCVATTVFSNKPTGLITASTNGQKGHEALELIMETVSANFIDQTSIIIQGIKGKIDDHGQILDKPTKDIFMKFIDAYKSLIK